METATTSSVGHLQNCCLNKRFDNQSMNQLNWMGKGSTRQQGQYSTVILLLTYPARTSAEWQLTATSMTKEPDIHTTQGTLQKSSVWLGQQNGTKRLRK
jgi:hypothetical protein